MKNWKKILMNVSVVTMALMLVACGADTQGGTEKETNKEAEAKNDDSTFIYAISGDPNATNPIITSDRWGLTMTNIIYSPLLTLNDDGTTQNVLAESVDVSEDGLAVSYQLKKGVKWSDGEDFTADDVVFTYEQKIKKENGNADNFWINDQPITVEKTDDYSVKFNIPTPSAAAINNIGFETYIIPKHVYKDVTDFSVSELPGQAVGTGPYKLVEYKPGEYIKFEANELYFNGAPTIKNLILRIVENRDTAKVALQKGEVDATFVLPNDIQDLDESKITVYPYSENRVGYMGLNSATEQLKDVRVRQAILFALDKNELNRAAYLNEEYYDIPYTFLPPKNPFAMDKVEKYETNIEKSKELLKEAGVTDLKINLGFSASDPVLSVQATLVQQQLQKVGITVDLEGGDSKAIYAELKKPGSTKYNLFFGGYIMGNDPDPYSSLYTTEGRSNYSQSQNKEIDEIFNKGAIELDVEKRKEIYNELQKVIAEEVLLYPIVDNKKILAVNNRIGNVKEAGLVPIYTFEDISKLIIK